VHFERACPPADLHNEGRVRAITFRHADYVLHADYALYAMRPAAIMSVPAQREPRAPTQPATLPAWATNT